MNENLTKITDSLFGEKGAQVMVTVSVPQKDLLTLGASVAGGVILGYLGITLIKTFLAK